MQMRSHAMLQLPHPDFESADSSLILLLVQLATSELLK